MKKLGKVFCDSHELADDLDSARLSKKERSAWAAALRKGRKRLKPLQASKIIRP